MSVFRKKKSLLRATLVTGNYRKTMCVRLLESDLEKVVPGVSDNIETSASLAANL